MPPPAGPSSPAFPNSAAKSITEDPLESQVWGSKGVQEWSQDLSFPVISLQGSGSRQLSLKDSRKGKVSPWQGLGWE